MDGESEVSESIGHSPHPKFWDRLNKIYGEAQAVPVALQLDRLNMARRKIPLTGPDELPTT